MTDQPDLLEVGRIVKAHGLKGEVVVALTTNRVEERTAKGEQLWAGDRWLKTTACRPHQDKWLYTFEGVSGRTEAESLRGTVLSAEPLEDEGEVWVHHLVDRRLVDQHGNDHGPVVAVVANPAADLLELGDGRLVPLNFYVAHDEETVTVEVPLGLLDDGALETPR